jgi:hypothetical protein
MFYAEIGIIHRVKHTSTLGHEIVYSHAKVPDSE